ncbi:50S ribosomal protein L23 [Blattabacterium cuenoti]|uniref:50S ribosomal protein L23 n=1 Tax=Blattabacterium cuenoti TaxID=1653831 RepID=UPI00163D3565|nr:50S ribosomal protein L23 [Blattabacterium cuenoti]
MILIKPILTDKLYDNKKNNFCAFFVDVRCNKNQVKKKIYETFGYSVKNVRVINYYRKDKSKITKKGFMYGKRSRMKKAIIQFKKNQKIESLNQKIITNGNK